MSELKDKEEQYSIFLKYKESSKDEDKNLTETLKKVVIVFLIVVLGICVSFVINNYEEIKSYILNFTQIKIADIKEAQKADLTPSKFNFKMLNRYQNILLLGVDSNGPNTLPYSGVRSDTIIILSVDVYGKSFNAISVPRDSKVYLADEHGIQKINAAYAIGGIDLTKKTIEETLGIKIHNYVVVNAEGVRKLIDTIGGVPVHIDNSMHYRDFSGKLNINFSKGDYVLNGQEAEEFLRFRKDSLGDIGRVHRQQKFIKALIEQVKSPETLRKIPEVLKIASLYTRTDLNLYQMSQYAALAREIDLNKVEFMMLPGAPNKKGIISYWILDPDKTQQAINRLIYRKKIEMAKDDISIGILYSKDKELEAFSLKEQLKSSGYDVNCIGKSSQIRSSEIVGFNNQITKDMIKAMQRNAPEISTFGYTHNPIRTLCNTSDIVITIKGDELI